MSYYVILAHNPNFDYHPDPVAITASRYDAGRWIAVNGDDNIAFRVIYVSEEIYKTEPEGGKN